MDLTAGYLLVEAASAEMSVLKFALACAPNAVKASAAVVEPVPPLAIGKVPVTPVVKGKPVALVNTPDAGVPKAGEVNVGDVNVLFVKVSVPVKVAKVPEALGKVMVVVPAQAGAANVAVPEIKPSNAMLVAEATPKVGVSKVGEDANTKAPDPVSLVTAVAKFALVGVPKKPPTPVPKSLTSAITTPAQAGAAETEPVPVCVKNCLVDEVLPVKSEVVLAAD